MLNREHISFVKRYTASIQKDEAAIFAGAGLSIPAGLVSWKELLRDIAGEIGLDVDKETDLISLAQYYKNKMHGRGEINQRLINAFSFYSKLTPNHRLLASIPINVFWTTNYDHTIEDSLKKHNKIVDIKRNPEDLAYSVANRDVIVYKMHGDIDMPQKAVLTKDDYENYNNTRQLFTTALQGDLVTRTFLFIGFSFDDPNLSYILSRIRILLGEDARNHYCFFRNLNRNDYHDDEEYRYAQVKQELKIEDLKRYHIQALMVDEYAQIAEILQEIKDRLYRKNIFISGAASIYDPFSASDGEDFAYHLSANLISRKYKIISGFGLGIGSAVVNGALSYVYSESGQSLKNNIIILPFPQNIMDDDLRKARWTKYREDMISDAGIAIFIFGNKISKSGSIIDSEGMYEEYDIAISLGVKVIPIGITGFAAEKIYDRIMKDPDKHYKNSPEILAMIKQLNEQHTDSLLDLIDPIINIIDTINK